MAREKKSSPTLEQEKELFLTRITAAKATDQDLTPAGFLQRWNDGYFFVETADAVYRMSPRFRHTIPVQKDLADFRLPNNVLARIKEAGYTVSTNICFDQIMDICAEPRADAKEEDRWIRGGIKRVMRELHKLGYARSIEVWHDKNVVGGSLVLHTGSICTSMSVFSHRGLAGYAAAAEVQARLIQAGFVAHDSIIPTNISRFFGGKLISFQEDGPIRRRASCKALAFPEAPVILPAEKFPQPHFPQATNHGRTFTCQERHAPKGCE